MKRPAAIYIAIKNLDSIRPIHIAVSVLSRTSPTAHKTPPYRQKCRCSDFWLPFLAPACLFSNPPVNFASFNVCNPIFVFALLSESKSRWFCSWEATPRSVFVCCTPIGYANASFSMHATPKILSTPGDDPMILDQVTRAPTFFPVFGEKPFWYLEFLNVGRARSHVQLVIYTRTGRSVGIMWITQQKPKVGRLSGNRWEI